MLKSHVNTFSSNIIFTIFKVFCIVAFLSILRIYLCTCLSVSYSVLLCLFIFLSSNFEIIYFCFCLCQIVKLSMVCINPQQYHNIHIWNLFFFHTHSKVLGFMFIM